MSLMFITFFRQYGAPIVAGVAILGFIWVQNLRIDRLQMEKTVLQGREATYIQTAQDNAADLAALRVRLEAEQQLSVVRLEAEQDRRSAAEGRNNRFTGAINDLQRELEGRQCGIGPVLSDGLRINREEREAGRRSREIPTDPSAKPSVQTGG